MQKIKELTKEQEAYLPVFRDEWLKVGLSTKSIEKAKADKAISNLYAAGGLEQPMIMHFQSPWQCIMAINFLQKFGELPKANLGDNLRDNLRANLRDNLRDNLGANLWANLGDNLWANLGDNLGANLWANLGDNLWANLGDNLRDNLWANLGANLWANLGDNLWANLRDNLWANSKFIDTWFWAGQDASWLAFYEFGEKIGVEYGKKDHFHAYINFAKTCGWGYFYPGIAIVSDRPEIIKKDDEARLHCEDDPALKFRDGYSVYCWHGQNIPADWIEKPDCLTPEMAITWENVDQRSAACEILGWHHIINSLDAKIIDEDKDPQIGRLVEINLPDHGRQKFIHAKCGTGREVAVMADANAKTIIEAQAASYGLKADEFLIPEVRT